MIFIIGGNGFVGSAFVRYCEDKGLNYTVITRANYNKFLGSFCDILINANGNSKKYLSDKRELEDFDASVKSVRSSLVDFKYKLYVHISSCDVYSDCSNTEATREDAAILVNKQSKYGFHKYMAELCVQHIADKWLIFRMGGFVGRNLKKNPVFDIINGAPLWIDPESELQYINTDDAAGIVMELVDRDFYSQTFNLCGDGVIKLKDVVEMSKYSVSIDGNRPCVRYEVNIDKIKQAVNIPLTVKTIEEFIQKERLVKV